MCWTPVDDSSRYRCSQFGDVLSSSDMSLHRKLQWGDHGNSLFWDCFTNWSIWDCCNVVAGREAELQFLMDFTSKVSIQYSCLFGSWRNYFVSRLFIHWIRNLSFFMEHTISFLMQQTGLIIGGTILIMLLKWRFLS